MRDEVKRFGAGLIALRREEVPAAAGLSPRRDAGATAPARDHADHYRPDIDGLRAIAVLAVVAFHLGVPGIRGGYVGVDIFFVISGYLITGIILRDIEAGRFSLRDFYARRIRRIMPALMLVLGVTTVLAVLRLYPGELVDYTKSLVAAVFSVSNLYFLSKAQYFGGAAESMPLLHTWSLAIEEQFYLFFPLVLLLAARGARPRFRIGLVVLAIAAVSFAISVILVAVHQERAFFLLVSRAWELCAGAVLAIGLVPALRHRWLAEALGFGGLLLIAATVLLYHRAIDFPGVLATAPVAAAAAIIYAGGYPGTLVARLLSLRPMVAIGLVSYSLYLWHWPLIVFWHLETGQRPDFAAIAGLFALALALSWLTWRYVETPFRHKGSIVARHPWASASLAALLVIAFAAPGVLSGGWPQRFTPSEVQMASYLAYDDREIYRRGTCFIDSHVQPAADFEDVTCLALSDQKPNVLILGDSHAAHLWQGMATQFPDSNMLQATASGCKPLQGGKGEKPCLSIMNRILSDDALLDRLDAVVLSARWEERDLPLLEQTIASLAPKVRRIYVMGPVPTYGSNLPRLLAQAEARGPEILDASLLPEAGLADKAFAAALAGSPARYVSAYDLLCTGEGPCLTRTASGVPVQWDYGHLTLEGATTLWALAEEKGLFP